MQSLNTGKNLRFRYIIGLGVIALLVTTSFLTMQHLVSNQREFSSIINFASHQSGLANRIAYFVSLMATTEDESDFLMARSQLGRTIKKMENAHYILRNGDPENNIRFVSSKKLKIIYDDPMVGLDTVLSRFLEKARIVYKSEMDTFNIKSAAYLSITTYGPHVLEPLLDAAVDEYEEIGRNAILKIERFELAVWLTLLLTLIAEIGLIFWPIEKHIQKTLQSLESSISELSTTRKRLLSAQKLAKVGDWELHTSDSKFIWSDQIYQICGVSQSDFNVTLSSALEMVHPDDKKKVGSLFEMLKSTGQRRSDMEFRIIQPDGTERLVYQRAVAIRNKQNRIEMIYGTMQDVTERKEFINRLEKLSENIPGFIFQLQLSKDGEANIPYASSGIKNLVGLYPEQVTKSATALFELFHEEDIDRVRKNMMDSSKGQKIWRNQYRIHHPQKGTVWMEGHATPERQRNGGTLWYGYIWDITSQKKDEEHRNKLENQLNQAHKMQAIGTLAGGIAHDFNNILSGILGYAQLAKYDLEEPDKAKEDVDQIEKAAHRASSLVQQILAFSRQSDDQSVPIRFKSLLKETVKLIRSSIPTNIEIKLEIESNPTVFGDSTKLHQVIMNLCTNAYHAMSKTGGTLTLELGQLFIPKDDSIPELNLLSGNYARLIVSDTGHGMEKKVVERIFDPYFTTKEVGKGTGLGLSVVDGIVKSHNGFIKVYSEIDKGTTFQVFLPMAEGESEAINHDDGTLLVPGTEHILLVDDETDILDALLRILEKQGYTVTAFSDPIEALDAFKTSPDNFDVVITDMTMPKMTGDQLSKNILTLAPDIPIIICSGFNENINETALKKIGIKEYVLKPVIGQELSKIIRRFFD